MHPSQASFCENGSMDRDGFWQRRYRYITLQPLPSLVVVILAADDSAYTAVHRRQSSISGGWQPPLEQSAA